MKMPAMKTAALFAVIAVAGFASGKYIERKRQQAALSGAVDGAIAANPGLF